MKNKTLLLSALAVFGWTLLFTSSCKKNGGPVTAPIGVIGRVGDSNFVSTSAESWYDSSKHIYVVCGNLYRSYNSSTYDSSTLSLYFPAPIRVNVPISGDSVSAFLVNNNTYPGIMYIGGGKPYGGHMVYEVTSWDSVSGKMMGTFSGTILSVSWRNYGDSIVVTDGAFNVICGGHQ